MTIRPDHADLVTSTAKYDWRAVAQRAAYHFKSGKCGGYREAYREALLAARGHRHSLLLDRAMRASETPIQDRARMAGYIDCRATYVREMAEIAAVSA